MKESFLQQFSTKGIASILLFSILFSLITNVRAQTSAPDSDEVKELKEKNAILEQKLKLAENEKKLLDVFNLKSDVKPLDGSIKTGGDAFIETEMLAYTMMIQVADTFGGQICRNLNCNTVIVNNANGSSNGAATVASVGGRNENVKTTTPVPKRAVFIFNRDQINDYLHYLAVQNQLKLFKDEYEKAVQSTKPSPTTSPSPAPSPGSPSTETTVYGFNPILALPVAEGLIKAGIEIASLFKTNTEIQGKTFQIQETALASAISRSLVSRGVPVKYPSLLPPNLSDSTSDFLTKIDNLQKQYAEIIEFLKPLVKEKKELDDRVFTIANLLNTNLTETELNRLKAEKTAKENRSKQLAARMAPYTTLNQSFTDFLMSFQAVKDNAGTTAMIRVLTAEKLKRAVDAGTNSTILFPFVIRSGGNVKISKNLFRSDKMYQSGGFIGSYYLFDKNGSIIATNIGGKYDGYFKVRNKAVNGEALIP